MRTIEKIFIFLCFITLSFFVQGATTESDNEKEGYYLIIVEHTYDSKESDGYNNFINSVCNDIQKIIVDNKSTYQHQEELETMEKKYESHKVDENSKSPYVYPISCIKGESVLYSYLTPDVIKKVKSLPYIIGCEPDSEITINDKPKVPNVENDKIEDTTDGKNSNNKTNANSNNSNNNSGTATNNNNNDSKVNNGQANSNTEASSSASPRSNNVISNMLKSFL